MINTCFLYILHLFAFAPARFLSGQFILTGSPADAVSYLSYLLVCSIKHFCCELFYTVHNSLRVIHSDSAA